MLFQKLYTRYAERIKPLPSQPVTVQELNANTLDTLHAFDISLKGIGVKTPYDYQVHSGIKNVELVITLPKRLPFKARGILRHETCEPDKSKYIGVEFVDISNQALSSIRHYMEESKLFRSRLAC